MENSYDFTTPSMVSWSLQSNSSDSDWNHFNPGFSSSSLSFPPDDFVGGVGKAESLSGSHRLAEKRRRDRINSHLSSLRKLVPSSQKLDKAALLATVIEQVKELKQKAKESPIFHNLPTEADEVTVHPEQSISDFESETIFKASFCCEDQPEAISEITRVLTKFQLETIQAEIICVGGRMRINFIVKDCKCKETTTSTPAVSAKVLKQSLCAALNRISSSSSSSSSSTASICRIRSKRQRWFLSSHYSQ